MKFELNLVDINTNEKVKWIYDNCNSQIYDYKTSKEINMMNIEESKEKKSKRLCISLGFSCDMKCNYCLQSKTKKTKTNYKKLNNLISKIKLMNLENINIQFWGGEPLLYLKEIEFIVNALQNKEIGSYSLITNGNKLNLKLAKYLFKNNFYLTISHDAQSQKSRGLDCLDNQDTLEAINYFLDRDKERFSINSVLNDKNIETKERLSFFIKKLKREDFFHSGEGFAYNTQNADKSRDIEDKIYKDLFLEDGIKYNYYTNLIWNFINIIKNNKPQSIFSTKCGIDKDSYNILSLDGRKLTCHNYNEQLEIITLQNRKKCKDCILSLICFGGCPIISEKNPMFQKNCETMFSSLFPLFRIAIYIMSNYKYQLYKYKKLESE